ncbi:hypothetical protein N7520_010319 [Penicillium odoratum]|uniref:uncharacterized protein n=1 Tax=Penicillium odoratum TaxID=1167516 RepID=UPI0025486B9A|nr:uncharacterized protein N7520_010319 [Penicillium odoratum]KAJ5745137.1 hypothetical protein N7520_010319 [Penicillium odoratum]
MRILAYNGLGTRQRIPVTVFRSQHRAFHAAVIGGGITGLTSAHHLSRNPKCSSVTIHEKSPRLGGWMQSERIPVKNGDVIFEYGPRTIRCSDATLTTWWMAETLGLADEAIWTPKNAPASANRFIYYPDHLVRLPSSHGRGSFVKDAISTILKEPVFKTFIPALLTEPFKPPRPFDQWQKDESISDFISRRFTPEIADNLVSAMMHGIYAGDIDKLSAQALMGPMRNMDDTGILSGILNQMLTKQQSILMDNAIAKGAALARYSHDTKHYFEPGFEHLCQSAGHAIARNKSSSTLTFKQGTQQLVDAIVADLKTSKKVKMITGSEVQAMSPVANSDKIYITSRRSNRDTSRENYDRVIATLPAPALAKVLDSTNTNHPGQSLPRETARKLKLHDYAVTVMVVNLYYEDPNIIQNDGFGYLIPRSVPYDQNPECGLGVLFASASSWGLPTSLASADLATQDNAPGTKITVMLGGHYWDDWKESDYPDHDSAVKMARALLQRHIGIKAAPSVARSNLQRNAIPQYTVGHIDRMYDLSATVKKEFNKRLALAGNWYTGVGINDCIRQGILAATYGIGEPPKGVETSGLGEYNYFDWDLEGGIPTSPVQYVNAGQWRQRMDL